MEIGAQFFTIREHCKTLEDFAESLKKVADIGYTNVQISGTCDYEPEWLAAELKKNGLKCVLTHTKADILQADPVLVAKKHDVFDCKNTKYGSQKIIFEFSKNVASNFKIYVLEVGAFF